MVSIVPEAPGGAVKEWDCRRSQRRTFHPGLWGSQSWLPPAFSRRLAVCENRRLKTAAGKIARPATITRLGRLFGGPFGLGRGFRAGGLGLLNQTLGFFRSGPRHFHLEAQRRNHRVAHQDARDAVRLQRSEERRVGK